jgi:RHS repeat-associated protein
VDEKGKGHPLAAYRYDAFSRIAQLTRDNQVQTNYQYDMAGQLTDIAHTQGGQTLASAHYDLDVLGRRTAQTREDNITERYTYDATSQLTGVDYGTGSTESFAYDPVGNRTEVGRVVPNAPFARENYQSNTLNQYTRIDSTLPTPRSSLLSYDPNGNLIADSTQNYSYNSNNQLITVESATTRAEFFYDARNRCVLRKYYTKGSQAQWVINSGDSRALTYDTRWNLLSECTLNGAQVGSYIHGPRTDEILTAALATKTYYPLADGLGSTVAMVNSKGKIAERYRMTAYGIPRTLTSDNSPLASGVGYRFLFTGREWLCKVGLNDHRNRYYSPSLGRWPLTDPIRFNAKDVNLYRYVLNASILWKDGFGTNACTDAYDAIAGNIPDVSSSTRLSNAASTFNTNYIDPITLMVAIAGYESGFNPNAVNGDGTNPNAATGYFGITGVAKTAVETRIGKRCGVSVSDQNGQDWRTDPAQATKGAYLNLLDRIAANGNDFNQGLRYAGTGNPGYASNVVGITNYITNLAADQDGDLRSTLEAACQDIQNYIDTHHN